MSQINFENLVDGWSKANDGSTNDDPKNKWLTLGMRFWNYDLGADPKKLDMR